MTERDQIRMLFHGAIVFMIGLIAGIPMGQAISRGWGEDVVRAWRVAHVGVAVGGLMLIALAPALRLVTLQRRQAGWLVTAFVVATWAAAIGLPLGAIVSARGLEPGHSVANTIVFLLNAVLAVGTIFGTGLLILGARASLQGRR